MGNWIETLLSKLGELWPYVKFHPWEAGVLIYYIPGWWKHPARTVTRAVSSGVYFLPWYYGDSRKESIVPQVMDLLSQTVVLRSGEVVSFSVNIEYEITDAQKNILSVHDYAGSLEAASRIHLAQRVREMANFAELIEKQKWLETSLTGTLSTRAKPWGITINNVGFTDLMPSKAFRLLGDSPWTHVEHA